MTLYYLRGFIERTTTLISSLQAQISQLEGQTVALSQIESDVQALAAAVESLAAVATSGSYTDLSDKPTIPTLPTLATVATSGSYADLTNTPSLAFVPLEFSGEIKGGRLTLFDAGSPRIFFWNNSHRSLVDLSGGFINFQERNSATGDFVNVPFRISVDSSHTEGIRVRRSIYFTFDNVSSIGEASRRVSNLYLVNSPIVTSDQREKAEIRQLSEAELRAVTRLTPKIFRWVEGGDRLHCGAIAQEVAQAFTDEGLDPYSYSLNCRDEWWEWVDLDGETQTADIFEDVPEEFQGEAIQKDRLGLRLSELFGFAFAALQQEIRGLKERVSVLEAQ